jgi:hypothetical protein
LKLQQIYIERAVTDARVLRWTGYFEQVITTSGDTFRGTMTVELYFADNHKICGSGGDDIGLFTCRGKIP